MKSDEFFLYRKMKSDEFFLYRKMKSDEFFLYPFFLVYPCILYNANNQYISYDRCIYHVDI